MNSIGNLDGGPSQFVLLFWQMHLVFVILFHWGCIGNTGKEHGNYYIRIGCILGLYRE